MKILLAVDGSAISTNAARYVTRLAKQLAQPPKLVLFHADAPLLQAAANKLGKDAVRTYHDENGQFATKPARAVLKRAQLEHETVLVVAEPAEAIVEHARARRCDLIVMGSHGNAALKSLLLGSVTSKVIAHCDIPVTVVR